jgi:hypothetical protein
MIKPQCRIIVACAALLMAAGLSPAWADTAPPVAGADGNKAISVNMTCADLRDLIRAGEKQSVGVAILWLDGVYADRATIESFPSGWMQTLGQAVGGMCAITVNGSRLVIDVIADVHKQYGQSLPTKAP